LSERVKTHNLVGIPLGDWSDDGHGKFETFHLLIPVQFTQEILSENYLKNKELFGFGLKDFANDYEDGRISMSDIEKLQEHGFEFSEASKGILKKDEDAYSTDFSRDNPWLNTKAMLEIVVFFIGYGLEDFTARVKEPDFYLFGQWAGPESMIGYGLFD
jgi:hypothetical protein